jgi:hypothetical protein
MLARFLNSIFYRLTNNQGKTAGELGTSPLYKKNQEKTNFRDFFRFINFETYRQVE